MNRSQLNSDTGIRRIASNCDKTAISNQNESIRSMNKVNTSSNAPTKEYIIVKSQAIADQNFEFGKKMKLVRIDDYKWWCWSFPQLEKNLRKLFPWIKLPRFRRVREMTIREKDGQQFLWCDCGFYERIGFPCPHFFCLTCHMSTENFHIRHWKMYESYYGSDSKTGELMKRAQVSLVVNKLSLLDKYHLTKKHRKCILILKG